MCFPLWSTRQLLDLNTGLTPHQRSMWNQHGFVL